MPFELPGLQFEYDVLEPVIDTRTMHIHHKKHHGEFVKKLNDAVSGTPRQDRPIEEVLVGLADVPEDLRTAVRNNGGGHYNHSLFWEILIKPTQAENEPKGVLATRINDAFGSFEQMKEEFAEAAKGRFGSGWAWLCAQPDGALHVASTANQDNPIMPVEFGGHGPDHRPILGLDVWENAYYLNYQNDRPGYIDAWWRVVNWGQALANYEAVLQAAGVEVG